MLYASLVEDAYECIATIGPDLTVTYANQAVAALLGYQRQEVLGREITDLVHPDDIERALLGLSGLDTWGMAKGTTSFRLRHRDGTWRAVDMTGSPVTDGVDQHLAVYCRPATYQRAVDTVMNRLLSGAPMTEAIEPLLAVFDWVENDLHVAISWYEDGAHQFVSTGLPRELSGAERDPGHPWSTVRADGIGVHEPDPAFLDPRRRARATELGRGALWVESVPDAGSPTPALVTVWSRLDGPPPEGHAFGMTTARMHMELILHWSHQAALLEAAAHTDSLTGLPNRRSLFELLERDQRGGALLFCDLDRFKPINDGHGHHVGDEVLRQVATRIRHHVRADDVVARTGGDEFVVLAHGADDDQAADLVARIQRAMEAPFVVGEHRLQLGISIGTARSPDALTDADLVEADEAMLRHKARHGVPVRTGVDRG